MSFQGKELSPEIIQMIVNLKHHFDKEKKTGKFVSTKNSVKRVSKGLGIGEATVKRVMSDYNKGVTKECLPKNRGKPPYRMSDNLQVVVREYIRQKNLKGQKVTVEQVREAIKESYETDIPMTTLRRTLERWGYVYGQGKRRSALKEQDYVILARRKYLRRKLSNRNSDGTLKRPEVYLDETFINKNHSGQFTWYLEDDGPWVNKPSGKGPRFIIVHAITKDGWVKDAQLIFEANKRTGDYHGQMNWDNFSEWFMKKLLPNIPKNSLIIMDNAKYHNVFTEDLFPTAKHRKDEFQAWLDTNNIPWTDDMLKPELFDLCKRFAPAPEFRLDQIARSDGHSILRTPQYHPELQPIEICWAIVKNYMADHCDFTMKNFREELPSAFGQVKARTCKKLISKIVEQEKKYWSEDLQLYE